VGQSIFKTFEGAASQNVKLTSSSDSECESDVKVLSVSDCILSSQSEMTSGASSLPSIPEEESETQEAPKIKMTVFQPSEQTNCSSVTFDKFVGVKRPVSTKAAPFVHSRKTPKCKMVPLKDAKGGQKFFRMYEDVEIGLAFGHLQNDDDDCLIDTCQDDDQATDDEILHNGEQQCM
jgi:hypothetical protein